MGVGRLFDGPAHAARRARAARIVEPQVATQQGEACRASTATPLPLGVASSASGLERCNRASWSSG